MNPFRPSPFAFRLITCGLALLACALFFFVPELTAAEESSATSAPGLSDSEPAAASPPALADVLEQKEETGFSQKSARALAIFVLVALVCYGAVQWQRKRVGPQDSSIKLVAVKSLGQRERVAVLEVLGEKMVVGVTANQISLLHGGGSLYSNEIQSGDSGK